MSEPNPETLDITEQMRNLAAELQSLSSAEKAWVVQEAGKDRNREEPKDKHALLRAYLVEKGEPLTAEDLYSQVQYEELLVPDNGGGETMAKIERNLLSEKTSGSGYRMPEDLEFSEQGTYLMMYLEMRAMMREKLAVLLNPDNNLPSQEEPAQQVWQRYFLPMLAEHLVRDIIAKPLPLMARKHTWQTLEKTANFLLEVFAEPLHYQTLSADKNGLATSKQALRQQIGVYEDMNLTYSTTRAEAAISSIAFITDWRDTEKLIKHLENTEAYVLKCLLWQLQMLREVGSNDAVKSMFPSLDIDKLDVFLASKGYEVEDGVYRQKRTAGTKRGTDLADRQMYVGRLAKKMAEPMVVAMAGIESEQRKYEARKKNEKIQLDFLELDKLGTAYEAKWKEREPLKKELDEIRNKLEQKNILKMDKYRGKEREELHIKQTELVGKLAPIEKELQRLFKEAEPYVYILGQGENFEDVVTYWAQFKALWKEKHQ